MTDINNTLKERGKRYGDFTVNTKIMQAIKVIMRDTPNWELMEPYQRESMEMFAHKIGRILGGDHDHIDSWHDISGYALLVEKVLQGEELPGAKKSKTIGELITDKLGDLPPIEPKDLCDDEGWTIHTGSRRPDMVPEMIPLDIEFHNGGSLVSVVGNINWSQSARPRVWRWSIHMPVAATPEPQPKDENEGWIPNPGMCPVDEDEEIEVKFRNGTISDSLKTAPALVWVEFENYTITHYRLIDKKDTSSD